jgi:SSS family solute:Na+ symporter
MLEPFDVVIIVLSLVGVMAVGLWFARKWKDSADFFLAGRNVAWPFIGFSLFATNISSEHFVGLASAGHYRGLVEGGYEWIASYCLLVLAAVFAPQYLKHKVFTIPEFFEKRYGVEARVALSAYFLVMIVLTKTAVATYTGSIVIRDFTGWNLTAIMWGIGLFTAAYTMAGGLAAVIYTDFIQALILIAGSAVLTWVALAQVGWWPGLVTKLEAAGRMDLLSMVRPPDDPGDRPFTGFILGNFLTGGMFYWCMDQVNVQRVLGARNVNHARGGAILAGFLKIIPVFIMVLPGVIAFVLFPQIGADHNSTYSVLLRELMPTGLRGFVIAALLAALMSSLSSTFNSASTIVARDFLLRFRPQSSLKAQVAVGEIGLVAVMVAGILCAPLTGSMKTIWDYLQEVTGYLSVPFAVAGLLGILTRRVNRQGAIAGVIVGFLAGLFFFLERNCGWGLLASPYLASFLHRAFISGVLSAATMAVVSLCTRPPPQEVIDGSFYLFAKQPQDAVAGHGGVLADWRVWWWLLFIIVTGLWLAFR